MALLYGFFCMARTWYSVGDMCSLLALVFAIIHLYNFLYIYNYYSFRPILFSFFFRLIWYQYIRWNGWWYQHVLALYALLRRVILNGLTLQKFGYVIVCFTILCFVLCLCRNWLCGLAWKKTCICEKFSNVHLLMTEFNCPEVTLCSWKDVKIQLLPN